MFNRIWAAGAAVALVIALPAGVPAAEAGTSSPVSHASLAAAVAVGTVTSPSGAAMAGVPVDLYAWPSDAAVSALKPGALVPMTLVAAATTDSAGGYMLRVSAAKLAAAATEDGWANLEIDSPGAGLWSFSYPAGAAAGQRATTMTVNLGSGKTKHPWPCGYSSKGDAYGAIGPTFLRPRAQVWATVGQGYVVPSAKTKGDLIKFEYTEGASHKQASHLGIGLSAYGLNAGYDSEGSHTSTAARTEGFHTQHKNAWFQTEFKTGQFRFLCIASLPGQPVHRVKQHASCPRTFNAGGRIIPVHMCLWMVQSTGWFGGTQAVSPKRSPATPSGYCAFHQGGDSFGGDFGTAVDWAAGWDLGADLHLKAVDLKVSFNGSAQTGYDTNDHMYFQFGSKHNGYLCGTNGSEATAAQLVMRSNTP
jgi:hypothetical protein